MKIKSKERITKVCIDDFAMKKGRTYGTIMIDIETHRIVDIIFSRSNNDVSKWLKSYPNIKVGIKKTTGINPRLGVKRKSKLDAYVDSINSLIQAGSTSKAIYSKIKDMGYTGSESLIRTYRAQNKGITYSSSTTTSVKRSSLIKLLYKPVNKIKDLSNEIISEIYNSYPIYKEIINLLIEFKNILNNKIIDEFQKWLHKAAALKINEINSFINGLTRDIDAVKNAILYEYNIILLWKII
ncbi:transposase [Clostridium botulinum]|uniref:transposase n=3 Tax=Clostridium botulinum TaxID=1491 RepID=UPI001E4E8880|nr:transposase [Clostridium botulinum]MCD3235249.1 transposase [Clostridium botulinum D/C]MCD3321665.1 transposase [Clostridium botulinum D/C]